VTAQSKKIQEIRFIFIFSLILFLVIDIFAGRWLLAIARNEQPKDDFRISHEIFHHTLKPNYNGIGFWGPGNYRGYGTYHVCTNGSGFKDRCENVGAIEKSFDIGFIGDSFTEGVGMPFEKSFVGMVANKFPELKIANLGVVSYAPSIYLAKLKELYKEGYSFKNVIVFIDIGDVQDEALTYEVVNGKVLSRHSQLPDGIIPKLRRYASRLLPLTGFAWNKIKDYAELFASALITEQKTLTQTIHPPPTEKVKKTQGIQNINLEPNSPIQTPIIPASNNAPAMPNAPKESASIYESGYTRSAWTFNPNTSGYGPDGIQGTIKKMQSIMEELYELTRASGSTLSVGVYPWPGQIKFDVENSIQVQIWKEFCVTRCKHFYNAFPAFFKEKVEIGDDALLLKYYMGGDMHFNALGNAVIAETIFNEGVQ
jgi:hypothetical protein